MIKLHDVDDVAVAFATSLLLSYLASGKATASPRPVACEWSHESELFPEQKSSSKRDQ